MAKDRKTIFSDIALFEGDPLLGLALIGWGGLSGTLKIGNSLSVSRAIAKPQTADCTTTSLATATGTLRNLITR